MADEYNLRCCKRLRHLAWPTDGNTHTGRRQQRWTHSMKTTWRHDLPRVDKMTSLQQEVSYARLYTIHSSHHTTRTATKRLGVGKTKEMLGTLTKQARTFFIG